MSPPPTDALSQSIEHTSAAASSAAAGEEWPWLFARCWMIVDRFDHHGRAPGDLDAALADFARLPEDAPGRARLAAVIVDAQLRSGQLQRPEQIDAVSALASVADGDPTPLPHWPANRSAIRALWLMICLQQGRAGVDPRSALTEIEQLAAVVGTTQPHATVIESARIVALHLRSQQDGDLSGHDDLTERVERLAGSTDPGSPVGVRARVLSAMQAAQTALNRGDMATAMAEFDRATAMRPNLPATDPLVAALDEAVSSIQALRGMMGGATATAGGPAPDVVSASLEEMRRRAARTDLSLSQRATNLAELGTAEMAMAEETHDVAPLDSAVEHLREAVALSPTHDPNRTYHFMSCGGALVRRYEIRHVNGAGAGHRRELGEAVDLLEQGQQVAGGPAHPYWSTLCQVLSDAYRLAGRMTLARETGRDGLRGHAWSVLLQSRTGAATAAARDAASEAVDVARAYLTANDPAGAATALDAGRGLVLLSAVQFSDVAERLTALGDPDLAQRWRQAVGNGDVDRVPFDLRREVVSRLSATPAPGGASAAPLHGPAVDPPASHEVRAALAKLGADALVYLVPGDDGDGAAVVVSAHDEPSWLPLPQLAARSTTVLNRYIAEGATRDTRSVLGPARDLEAAADDPPAWHDSLGDVCDWAWTAAMGPLLDHLPRRHDLPTDRPPRLVLVPMGVLARVPWHAARQVRGGQQHYAVAQAVFSYAVSARMLCDSAWAEDRPVTASGLVIGDPDTGRRAADLPAARIEALAIRDAFYPGARYLGRNADGTAATDGTGSRDDVQRWLADDSADAGTVLHAACHGVVQAGTDDAATSYLLLADGIDGNRLAAEDLVRTLTTRRSRGLALTVLAACSSGVTGRGYDEAFSLGTAFLASGTRSVVSALWRIPDSATSVLMFMFHHLLRTLPAADALRAAQLWMLQPDRQPPDTMPDTLRRQLSIGDPTDVAAWAGFTHAGR